MTYSFNLLDVIAWAIVFWGVNAALNFAASRIKRAYHRYSSSVRFSHQHYNGPDELQRKDDED